MTTVNNTPISTASSSTQSQALQDSKNKHHGIMDLIRIITKINSEVRNADYSYSIEQDYNGFNQNAAAYNDKSAAAEERKKGGILTAAGGLLSGIGGAVGTFSGDNGFRRALKFAEPVGKMGEAGFTIGSNIKSSGASNQDRLADFTQGVQKYFEKDAESFLQKARASSQQMKEATQALVQLQAKITDAIKIS